MRSKRSRDAADRVWVWILAFPHSGSVNTAKLIHLLCLSFVISRAAAAGGAFGRVDQEGNEGSQEAYCVGPDPSRGAGPGQGLEWEKTEGPLGRKGPKEGGSRVSRGL